MRRFVVFRQQQFNARDVRVPQAVRQRHGGLLRQLVGKINGEEAHGAFVEKHEIQNRRLLRQPAGHDLAVRG